MTKAELDEYLERFHRKLTVILAQVEHVKIKQVWITRDRQDLIRLVNWEVWCQRESVDLAFIIRTLLAHYRRVRRHSGGVTFGIHASALTGPRSRTIIADAVAQEFPGGENELVQKVEFQQRIASAEFPIKRVTAMGNESAAIDQYQKQAEEHRRRLMTLRRRYLRRHWRKNPWL